MILITIEAAQSPDSARTAYPCYALVCTIR